MLTLGRAACHSGFLLQPACRCCVHKAGRIPSLRAMAAEVVSLQSQPQQTGVAKLLLSGRRLTQAAHGIWQEVVQPGDLCIDASCGNGHDCLQLAHLVGSTGRLLAMDLQEAAITSTMHVMRPLLQAGTAPEFQLVQACHSTLQEHVDSGSAKLVCFNLGYLPQTDHTVKTEAETTLRALQAAMNSVMVGGMVTVMVYLGHAEGLLEHKAICGFVAGLTGDEWGTLRWSVPNRPTAPELFILMRRR